MCLRDSVFPAEMQMVGWTTRAKAAVCCWQDPRNIYASDDQGFVRRKRKEEKEEEGKEVIKGGWLPFSCQPAPDQRLWVF